MSEFEKMASLLEQVYSDENVLEEGTQLQEFGNAGFGKKETISNDKFRPNNRLANNSKGLCNDPKFRATPTGKEKCGNSDAKAKGIINRDNEGIRKAAARAGVDESVLHEQIISEISSTLAHKAASAAFSKAVAADRKGDSETAMKKGAQAQRLADKGFEREWEEGKHKPKKGKDMKESAEFDALIEQIVERTLEKLDEGIFSSNDTRSAAQKAKDKLAAQRKDREFRKNKDYYSDSDPKAKNRVNAGWKKDGAGHLDSGRKSPIDPKKKSSGDDDIEAIYKKRGWGKYKKEDFDALCQDLAMVMEQFGLEDISFEEEMMPKMDARTKSFKSKLKELRYMKNEKKMKQSKMM